MSLVVIHIFNNKRNNNFHVKGKGFFYLTSVVPSVLRTVINGSRRCDVYPPSVLHFKGI